MNRDTKKIIFIVGPTAIGKTSLSIELAKALNTEIISCDSRQFYKELLIGSAPPSRKQLAEVKHHFIQHISIEERYNAGKFEYDSIKLIKKLHKKNNTIIAVGGSGLYIDAICKGFDNVPLVSTNIRDGLKEEFIEKGKIWLQDEIRRVDPEFYKDCDKNNSQRLLRALEVYKETNKSINSFKTKKGKNRSFKIIKIGLNTKRELLYDRINKRVTEMLQNGLVEEAHRLIPYQEFNALNTVGYKELFPFFNNRITLEEAEDNIKRNTRRFAKRQITWFRRDKEISWFKSNQEQKIRKFIGL